MPLQDGNERHVAQENLDIKARDARVPNQKVINYKNGAGPSMQS